MTYPISLKKGGEMNEKCCGNCARFIPDDHVPGYGWCDEWAGVRLSKGDTCHPYVGRPKQDGKAKADRKGETK